MHVFDYAMQQSLTLEQDSLDIVQIGLEEIGILGWDDGELRAAPVNRALSVSKLLHVLADMRQV